MLTDRESLARMLFTLRPEYRYQTWEQTSEGIRHWCRERAERLTATLMAEGWRKVGADSVVIRVSILTSWLELATGMGRDALSAMIRTEIAALARPEDGGEG